MAAYTMEQYTKLVEAISEGVLRVRYSDKEVQYNTLEEMLRLKKIMELDLGLAKRSSNRVFANYKKGI